MATGFLPITLTHSPNEPVNQFGNQGKLLNLGHLDFDIVSDFDIRISDFAGLGSSTLVERPLQIHLFMQNEPKFRKSQMNLNNVLTTDYVKWTLGERGKNKPNSKPIQSQFKPNSNPIQTQFKPNPNLIQTQFQTDVP